MSAIGPELPPHLLAKRKRKAEEEAADGPSATSGASRSSSPDSSDKRRRVAGPARAPVTSSEDQPRRTVGPAAPPAPLNERPSEPVRVGGDSSDDDDDYGPALPSLVQGGRSDGTSGTLTASVFDRESSPPKPQKPQRDEWMMVPPKQDDLSARMDPTKLRARKFNRGKGAKILNAAGGESTIWTETPEQKRKRLADEVMGVAAPASSANGRAGEARSKRDIEQEETARRIREHDERTRGKSLYTEHAKTKPQEKEDDPSKRAFDREKDIGGGMKIGHAQRKEMLNRAADFGSRFSGGSYL
ncbi:hypothetical protein B0A49_10570 [Cryomyces minteri]|uniref:DUF3752 domain-containing protein n=1 Tax=Cryomyces minteri TaxID=331657 RepID=A0A4U0WM39_9PEZI|nr:hypothetical protein B0A49_09416 [Cryomyces minteri]TKA63877.1 hypothetical protein B0A49_10570 [Cryomyces minteri]